MPFSLELPMNTPDWTDVGSGVRECYAVTQHPLAVWWYPLSALPRKMIFPAAFTFQLHNAPPLLDTNTTLPLAAGRYAAGITSLACNSPVWKDTEGDASPLATTRRPILVNVTRIEYGPSKLAGSLRVRESRSGYQGSLPEALRVPQRRDIRLEVVAGRGFDIAVSEHFAHDGDIGSRRQSVRRP